MTELPYGEGEHLWLDVEKNGANTAGVQERDVGYAGLKDRHAITRQ